MSEIEYKIKAVLKTAEIIELYEHSGLLRPNTLEYYPKIGMEKIENGFIFNRQT